jgi:hypothetical protein
MNINIIMKSIIKILLILFLSFNLNSQYSNFNQNNFNFDFNLEYKPKKKKRNLNPEIGFGMLIGGVAFTAASLTTNWTYVGGSTTEKQPFYYQPKLYTGATGLILITSGLIYLKISL